MAAIAIGLVAHSYALTSLFPYVGYMVQFLGVTDDKDEAGKLAKDRAIRGCLRKPLCEALTWFLLT